MISGGNATLYVSDMKRALRFYVETLGFKLAHGGEGFALVDAGDGFHLGLHLAGAHSPQPGTAGSIAVGLDVTGPLEEIVPVLENRGVVFRGPIVERGPTRLAFFSDADGNALYLHQALHLAR